MVPFAFHFRDLINEKHVFIGIIITKLYKILISMISVYIVV